MGLRFGKSFQEVLLYVWQFDVGAIASAIPSHAPHFFAFEARREADEGLEGHLLSCRCHGLLLQELVTGSIQRRFRVDFDFCMYSMRSECGLSS